MNPEEFLTVEDKTALDLAKTRVALAKANAERAAAQSESAELGYQNVVLKLAMKYKLSGQDGITEDGKIIRTPAAPTGPLTVNATEPVAPEETT